MIIFIRNIPDTTTREELDAFISRGLRRTQLLPFLRRERLQSSDILKIHDLDADRVEYHGLAYIDDDMEGAALIKSLNGSQLQGRSMQVREYFPRNSQRDRRLGSAPAPLAIVDRRRRERRRKNLRIETLYGSQPESASPAA
ncbi:MAG TPA: hypothetical protein ENK50_09490 [Sedimenticola sp.]|nr:hypothetical protein [Sedimenticola sp.]